MEKKFILSDEIESIKCNDLDEAETTIVVERKSNTAQIYTSDNTMLTKLKKQMAQNPNWKCWEAGRNSNHEVTGYFFEVPKSAISIRTGNKRVVSEEQIEATRKRFIEMHQRMGHNGQN